MTRWSSRFLILAAIFLMVAAVSPGARAGDVSTSIDTEDDHPLERCDQIKIRFGDWGDSMPMARGEEQLKAARSAGSPRILELANAGGIRVQSWDGDDYAIQVCKAAGAGSSAQAKAALEEISVSLDGRRLVTRGPHGESWLVYLIVKAPRDAEMELTTENGEIGLMGVAGKIQARSENGPISLKRCSQQVRATTQNGPISLSGGSGDFRLKAENGPISVDLTGAGWKGAGLEARTENGPLALKLPGSYRTGIRVESTGHSPMSCKAAECRGARKDWDEDHRWIEFGSEPATVKLYTENGPVSVESRSVEF